MTPYISRYEHFRQEMATMSREQLLAHARAIVRSSRGGGDWQFDETMMYLRDHGLAAEWAAIVAEVNEERRARNG